MHRRTFIASLAAASALPGLSLAGEGLAYTPGLVTERLAAGETVFLDFYTDWCSTCDRQRRVIGSLRAGDPAYDLALTFINVNWDHHRRSQLAKDLRIPRRSTLVALRGDQEIGRLVAETRAGEIEALMQAAVAAAQV